MEGKKVKQERIESPVLWKPSPRCQHPPTTKERCWAHTCPRRCEGSTALSCSGQQVPSGLSTTLHGVGGEDTGKASADELITARGSHRQVTERRPEGPHRGGRAGQQRTVDPSQLGCGHPDPQLSAPGTSQSGDCLPCQAQSSELDCLLSINPKSMGPLLLPKGKKG